MAVQIVDLLIDYEMTMAKLYSVCAECFPELESFWRELSDEEVIHANTIKELLGEVDNKTVFLNESRFYIRPIEISIEYAVDITRRVTERELNLVGILSLAYDIENSLIESKYHQIFTGTSARFNDRLKQVHKESAGHRDRLGEMRQRVLNEPAGSYE